MSKTFHIKVKAPKARVQVVTPKGGSHRDKRDKRSQNPRKSWRSEEMGYTLVELLITLVNLAAVILLAAVMIHFLTKFW